MQQCLDREVDSSYYFTGFPKIGTLDQFNNNAKDIVHKVLI